MFRMVIFSLPLCLWAVGAHCADDEVTFKPQTYKPRKELSTRTYSEKSYTVSDKAAARPTGKQLPQSQSRQPDMKPLVTKDPLNGKSLEPPPPMQPNPFAQSDKQTYASTISPAKTAPTERKHFVTNKVSAATFVPAEKPKEKNPLLQPRQGIKELPINDEQ